MVGTLVNGGPVLVVVQTIVRPRDGKSRCSIRRLTSRLHEAEQHSSRIQEIPSKIVVALVAPRLTSGAAQGLHC